MKKKKTITIDTEGLSFSEIEDLIAQKTKEVQNEMLQEIKREKKETTLTQKKKDNLSFQVIQNPYCKMLKSSKTEKN